MNSILPFISRRGEHHFNDLLAPHIRALYRQAWRYTGHTQDAEDLLQDLLLDLFCKQRQMSEAKNLPAWLRRCLHNRFVDGHRCIQRTPRHEDIDSNSDHYALAVPDNLERVYQYHEILRSVKKLSPVQRTVISQHDIFGFTLPELAVTMELPLGTLKSHLHRARARLKHLLEATIFVEEQHQTAGS